jgi:hypothetical protein
MSTILAWLAGLAVALVTHASVCAVIAVTAHPEEDDDGFTCDCG